ncbi:TPA: hypothetical protein ACVU43_002996 [Vibrio parahaemolyticus]
MSELKGMVVFAVSEPLEDGSFFIKKSIRDGSLAIFDVEQDAQRALQHNDIQGDVVNECVLVRAERAHAVIEEKDVRIKQLEEALRNVLAITTDSTGVAEYGLNDEVVAWDEFEEIEVAQSLLEANVGKIEYPEAE